MDFLHPWALWTGVLLVGLPIAIHWLTRPRPVRMPLSTIRFVRESIAGRRSVRRLRDWLVLALRAAAILLLAWAIGRPRFGEQALVTAGDAGSGRRVVLLDASHSLAAESGGVQLFQKAKAIAAGYLGNQPGLRSNLILIGARPRPVFERLSTSGAALREELARSEALPERANVQAALDVAGEMLAQATPPGEACEVVIVSDFQRANWASADFGVLPAGTRIQLDSVAPARPLDNLAVLSAGVAGRVEEGREARFEVEIGNYTTSTRKMKVDVSLEKASYRLDGVCPPGRTTLSTEIVLQGSGWQTGVVRLGETHDAIAADDSRPFAIDVRSAPTFVLISRQPAEAKTTSSYFLERALAPTIGATGPGRVVRMNPASWDRDLLAGASLLVLDHPGPIPPEQVKELAELVRRGRGMLFVSAEAEDAITLRRMADALESAWQLPVEFAPPAASARRKDLFLVETRKELAPWKVFGDQLARAIGPLRIGGGLASRQIESGLSDDILAVLSDRSAFLVVAGCGAGQVAVLNVDLAASNLPSSPAFVPVVGELTYRLLGSAAASSSFAPGELVTFLLPPGVGSADLKVEGPTSDTGRITQESGGLAWRPPTEARPGIYRIRRGDATVFAAAAGALGRRGRPAADRSVRPPRAGRRAGRRGAASISARRRRVRTTATGPGSGWSASSRAWSASWWSWESSVPERSRRWCPWSRCCRSRTGSPSPGRRRSRRLAWLAWRRPASIARRPWRGLVALAGAGVAVVLILLLNPMRVEPIPQPPGRPLLTILVDATASMATRDMSGSRSRYQAAVRVGDRPRRTRRRASRCGSRPSIAASRSSTSRTSRAERRTGRSPISRPSSARRRRSSGRRGRWSCFSATASTTPARHPRRSRRPAMPGHSPVRSSSAASDRMRWRATWPSRCGRRARSRSSIRR